MKISSIIIAALVLISCNANRDEADEPVVESSVLPDSTVVYTPSSDTGYEVVTVNPYYVWEVNAGKKTLRKNPEFTEVNVNADSVINGLNRQYEQIRLEKTGIKEETIHLKIANSNYLTNQSGTTGAAQYLAQAVINLTAVPGIKYVHIDFKEGSHAAPGTWSRKDFPGYIIIP